MTQRDTPTTRGERGLKSEQELKDMILSLPYEVGLSGIIEREEKIRFEQLRKDLANRLSKACVHLEKADFEALVDKIARVQIRGEQRSR